ncbi:hypothetical protein [Crossiella sp. NPDC003009]
MPRRILPVVGLAVLLAGCGGNPTAPGGSTPAPTSNPASATSAPPPTSEPGELTLHGKVSAGVEANCLVMESGGKQYLLVGGDPSVVKPGAEVEVRGVVKPDLVSTCQQGEPLEISSAKAR